MTIHKYPLKLESKQQVDIPYPAKIIKAGVQDEKIFIWAICNPSFEPVTKIIEMFGTGENMENAVRNHIDTVQINSFVWHVFEKCH
ncbi:hypothetical protein CMU84_16335 [Elizabethkingia anophelis]|nr:hypothetical protein [Elizabethkingia anophelis]MDV3734257.1 hypothetical protein [Elizabethkingia anophelis]